MHSDPISLQTHTRLSMYTAEGCLKPILDALQSELHLESKELQQLVIRMPSILGMSPASLRVRKAFFMDQGKFTIVLVSQ